MSNPAYGRRSYQRNRLIVLADSGGQCFVPGCRRPATTADHILPLAKGGSHDIANLRPSCAHHNSVLGAKMTNQIRAARRIGNRSRHW